MARMAPLVIVTTLLTLFGGSAGREGTAVQIGGKIAGVSWRAFGITTTGSTHTFNDRRCRIWCRVFEPLLLVPSLRWEVPGHGRHIRYDALVPCLIASIICR